MKRLFALFLALALVLTVLPLSVLALPGEPNPPVAYEIVDGILNVGRDYVSEWYVISDSQGAQICEDDVPDSGVIDLKAALAAQNAPFGTYHVTVFGWNEMVSEFEEPHILFDGDYAYTKPIPATVWYDLYINDVQVTDVNQNDVLGNQVFSFDPDTATLTLNGRSTSYAVANVNLIDNQIDGLTVCVAQDTTLEITNDDDSYTFICSEGDLTITGPGKLKLKGPGTGDVGAAIYMYGGDLTLDEARVFCTGMKRGLQGNGGSLAFRHSTFYAKTMEGGKAICNFAADGVTRTDSTFTLPGSSVDVSTGTACYSGTTPLEELKLRANSPYSFWIEDVPVTDANKADVLGNGVFALNTDTRVLTISDSYSSTDDTVRYLVESGTFGNPLTVVPLKNLALEGAAAPTITGQTLLSCAGDLTIRGPYALTLYCRTHVEGQYAVGVKLAGSGSSADGNTLRITDGSLTIVNATTGIEGRTLGYSALSVENSTLHIQDAVNYAVNLFRSGISLTGCEIVEPAGGQIVNNSGAYYFGDAENNIATNVWVKPCVSGGYYLIGPDWTVADVSVNHRFAENPFHDGEYMLNTTLAEGDPIKVVHLTDGVIDAWYPDGYGTEYTVDAGHAGQKTIYFKPEYDSAWSDFGGYFWMEYVAPPIPLFIDGVQVDSGNQSDVLQNGKFSYDGSGVLSVRGSYTGRGEMVDLEYPAYNAYDIIRNVGVSGLEIRFENPATLTPFEHLYWIYPPEAGIRVSADTKITGEKSSYYTFTTERAIAAVKVENGAKLTVWDTEIATTGNTGLGIVGSGTGETLRIYNSSVEVTCPADTAAISGFSNMQLFNCHIVEPVGGYVSGGTVREPDGTPASRVVIHPGMIQDGYYLIGPDWNSDDFNDANRFAENPDIPGTYVLNTELTQGDQILVVHVTDGAIDAVYPPEGDGSEYTVDAAHSGNVTIYFKTTYESAWSDFGGYIYIERKSPVNPFVDVVEGKYYYEPVLWAYYHDPQVTGGTDDTHFSPNKTCTREQIVTFLWKAKGAPEPKSNENPFTDVKSNKYYYKAVLWAVENGITGGVTKTAFGVGQPCKREQAMTFLWKAMGSPGILSSTLNPFTDVKEGKYYYTAVLWAVENGVTGGTTKTTFGVGKTCTRGQIVTFLYKAFAN